jgi:hypothetical protein
VSDKRLRELERRWKETGTVEDEATYLQERVRAGELTQEELDLAAYSGNPAALRLAGCETEFELALRAANRAFGAAPRQLGFFARRKHRLKRPAWLRAEGDGRFGPIYASQDRLLTDGICVWGRIVQANRLLYEPGRDDCPAVVLYSPDRATTIDPSVLVDTASTLYESKGLYTGDPELQVFADKLDDEHVTDLKLRVPGRLSQGLECYYTCIMVCRHHLPGGVLHGRLFPLIVCPAHTEATMILPGWYWPQPFVQRFWCSEL